MNLKECPRFYRWVWAMSYAEHLAYETGRRFRVIHQVGSIDDGTLGEWWQIVPAKMRRS